ncbi:STN and carboxypeptidase regulatory-like domain-containing protein [Chitinophaga sp. NPDC101104]|uniref:STN and carboxypeptidase regulatory-like domain-containing protein n=1 Tax=Chitinophaga sp. NPDC101104 TaxID=3390561 RepID=UPI003D01E506
MFRNCLIALLLWPCCLMAQQQLQQTVSFRAVNWPVDSVLSKITAQSGLSFSYAGRPFRGDSLVNLTVQRKPIRQVLDQLFQGRIRYSVVDGHIILNAAEGARERFYTISGYVRDKYNGNLIVNASIYERSDLMSAFTNTDGYFHLRLKDKGKQPSVQITVSKEFYIDTMLYVMPGFDREISIAISPAMPVKLREFTVSDKVDKTWLGSRLLSETLRRQTRNIGKFFAEKPVQSSLVPSLGSHGKMAGQVVNKFSLNLVGGYSAGLDGLEIAGGFNINKGNAQYAQVAGIFNLVGGSVRGVQVAGIFNRNMEFVEGAQIGGISNIADGWLMGAQISGIFNRAMDSVKGIQIAGLHNNIMGDVTGAQISGLMNHSGGHLNGLQISGLINRVRGNSEGAQITGLINYTKEMKGLQIAGLINHAAGKIDLKHPIKDTADRDTGGIAPGIQISGLYNQHHGSGHGVQLTGGWNHARDTMRGLQLSFFGNSAGYNRGVQFGLVNIADSSDGVAFGLVTIVKKKGYYRLEAFSSDLMPANLQFKSGRKGFYSILSGGARNGMHYLGLGFGGEWKLKGRLSMNTDVSQLNFFDNGWKSLAQAWRASPSLRVRLGNWVTVYGGPAFTFMDDNKLIVDKPWKGYPGFSSAEGRAGWLGWQAGLSFF